MITKFKLFENKDMSDKDFDVFLKSYIETMIWAEEEKFDIEDYDISIDDVLNSDSAKYIKEDISNFINVCNSINLLDGLDLNEIGNTYYLNRNGSGSGFFDMDYKNATETNSKLLNKISDVIGECYLDIYIQHDKIQIDYNYTYGDYRAALLSDYSYLEKHKNELRSELLFVDPIIGDRFDLLVFLIDNDVDWLKKDPYNNYFTFYLRPKLLKKLIDKYPEKYKDFELKKVANKFNI